MTCEHGSTSWMCKYCDAETVERKMNQCDGCQRRIPVVNGMHDLTGEVGAYPGEKMWCTKHLYRPQHGDGGKA